MVTALLTVAEATGAPWVACARTPAERELAATGGPVDLGDMQRPIRLHYVASDSDRYRKFYSVIANPLIWFLQHYLWDLTYEPLIDESIWAAWETGYVVVNKLLAEKVVEVARKSPRTPLVMTQDYQLYLAPRRIRQLLPEADDLVVRQLQVVVHVAVVAAQGGIDLAERRAALERVERREQRVHDAVEVAHLLRQQVDALGRVLRQRTGQNTV